jgi:magnesium-protoporphyrin IX monomethyl ester (oxidative) cyclase
VSSGELDIALVNMPFAEMQRPSLALGILKAILRSNAIRARTFEGQLLVLEHVSFEDYFHISRSPDWYQLGEWIFSAPAFPEMNGRGDGFVPLALAEGRRERIRFFHGHSEESLRELLGALRARAAKFIDALADEILATGAPIVGCSSTFQQHVASLALLRRLKQKRPRIVTMLGGGNCEGEMGVSTHRHFPFVDYVISGEADELIVPLVNGLLRHGAAMPAQELPEGVFAPLHRASGYPKADGANGEQAKYPRATIPSMDAVPTPDYDDYFETLRSRPALREEVVPALPIENSRGCYWGKCRFCGLNGEMGGQRIKSVDRILEDVSALTTRYGIDKLEVVDNILHPKHVPDLLKSLARRRGKYSIFYEV